MAIALDVATNGGSATATSHSYSHTCTGSNLILFVGVNFYNAGTDDITGVTYNSVAMTQIAKQTNASGSGQISYLYYLINPSTGANTVAITKTSSATIRSVSVSYTGANDIAQPDASGTNTSNASLAISKAVTTIADNCWMVSFTFNDANQCLASTGTTNRNSAGVYMAIGDSGGVITPAASYSMAWTLASGTANWTIVNASFAPLVNSTQYLKGRRRQRIDLTGVSAG